MLDLTPIISAVSGIGGPWGVAIGVGLTLAYNWWRARRAAGAPDPLAVALQNLMAELVKPSAPVVPPAPVSPVIPDEHKRPILDAILKALGVAAVPPKV